MFRVCVGFAKHIGVHLVTGMLILAAKTISLLQTLSCLSLTPADIVRMYSVLPVMVLRRWGAYGSGDGMFLAPSALALAGSKLFLRDNNVRVQVYE